MIRGNEYDAEDRLRAILNSSFRPSYFNSFTLDECLEHITIVSSDLITLQKTDLEYNFDTVIHCAGSTNLLNKE